MNKAEIEAQVVKLARGLARAEAQTTELKKTLKDAQQPTKSPEAPPVAEAKTTLKKAGSTPVKHTRRTKADMAVAAQAHEAEINSSDE